MIELDEEKRKRVAGEGEGGDQGSLGGQGGALAFRDFVFVQEERKLSPQQEKQLLVVHKETNSALIEKQKQERDERDDRKRSKVTANQYDSGMGMGAGKTSPYLKHPILGASPEFDGVDHKVNFDPTMNEAETNSEKKEELTYQHQLRLGLHNEPRFNPKPSPF